MGNERAAFGRTGDARPSAAGPRQAPNVKRLPLLCGWGRHDTGALAQWNDGYYFARCRRCGHDVVRTAFGRWTIPRGYRVVWGDHPPHDAPRARLIPAGEAPRARAVRVEFPIAEPSPAPEEAVPDAAVFAFAAKPEAAAIEADDHPPQPQGESAPVDPVVSAEPEPDLVPSTSGPAATETLSLEEVLRASRDADPSRGGVPLVPSTAILFRAEDKRPDDEAKEPHVLRDASDELVTRLAEDKGADQPETVAEPQTVREPELIPPPPALPAASPPEPTPAVHVEPVRAVLAEPTPEPAPEAPPSPKPLIPDFMTETAFEVPYDLQTGEILHRQDQAASRPSASSPSIPSHPPLPQAASIASAPGSGAVELRVGDGTRRARDAAEPGRRSLLERYSGIAAATIFGAFVLAAAAIDRSDAGSTPIGYRPIVRAEPLAARIPARPVVPAAVPASSPYPPAPARAARTNAAPTSDLAFVTASTLNCRATPNDDGPTVRKLLRGASVRVLGAGSGWVSVSHRGQQCWAAAEYVSAVRPS